MGREKGPGPGFESLSFNLFSLHNDFAPNEWQFQLQANWKPTPSSQPKSMALLCFLLDLTTLPPPILTALTDVTVQHFWSYSNNSHLSFSLRLTNLTIFFLFPLHLFSLCCSSPISMQFHHHHPLLESACAMSWRMPPLFLMMLLYEYAKTFTHIRTHKDRLTLLDRRRFRILFSRIWIIWIAEWNSWRLRIVLLDALVSVNFIVLWGICQRMPLFLKLMAMKVFVIVVSPFRIAFYLHLCWMFIELNLVVVW